MSAVEIALGTLGAGGEECFHLRVGALPTVCVRWLDAARLSGVLLGLGHEDEPPDTRLI
jgi:hypothetical protein